MRCSFPTEHRPVPSFWLAVISTAVFTHTGKKKKTKTKKKEKKLTAEFFKQRLAELLISTFPLEAEQKKYDCLSSHTSSDVLEFFMDSVPGF